MERRRQPLHHYLAGSSYIGLFASNKSAHLGNFKTSTGFQIVVKLGRLLLAQTRVEQADACPLYGKGSVSRPPSMFQIFSILSLEQVETCVQFFISCAFLVKLSTHGIPAARLPRVFRYPEIYATQCITFGGRRVMSGCF